MFHSVFSKKSFEAALRLGATSTQIEFELAIQEAERQRAEEELQADRQRKLARLKLDETHYLRDHPMDKIRMLQSRDEGVYK